MNEIGTSHIESRRIGFLVHVAAWTLLLTAPLFFTGRDQDVLTLYGYIRSLIVPFSFVLVFYANYLLLVDRFLFTTQHTWRFYLANLLLIATTIIGVHLLINILPPPEGFRPRPPHEREVEEIVGFLLVNALIYMLVAGLSVAIKATGRWYQVESSRHELEKRRAEAELQNLKSQLNPHFLFNTLNNIYSLIAFSPERAQEAVHDLSRLLRYVLYDSCQPMVLLDKEFDFIRNYIELMRIRLPEHVRLTTYVGADNPDAMIAPLLFISLIENAFKHGVSPMQPSVINIDIHGQGDRIVCLICNSLFPKDNGSDKSGSGIGLQNLSRRLELLYPARHLFTCRAQGDTYVCRLELLLEENHVSLKHV